MCTHTWHCRTQSFTQLLLLLCFCGLQIQLHTHSIGIGNRTQGSWKPAPGLCSLGFGVCLFLELLGALLVLYIPRIGWGDLGKLESGMGIPRDCVDLKSGEPVDVCTWSQGLLELENFPIPGGLPGSVHRAFLGLPLPAFWPCL